MTVTQEVRSRRSPWPFTIASALRKKAAARRNETRCRHANRGRQPDRMRVGWIHGWEWGNAQVWANPRTPTAASYIQASQWIRTCFPTPARTWRKKKPTISRSPLVPGRKQQLWASNRVPGVGCHDVGKRGTGGQALEYGEEDQGRSSFPHKVIGPSGAWLGGGRGANEVGELIPVLVPCLGQRTSYIAGGFFVGRWFVTGIFRR